MPTYTDVVIVGGGVIGCSIAYQLAKHGTRAIVLERSRSGSGASGATAGVIGPIWHLDPDHKAVFGLGMRSLDLFPRLASELINIIAIQPATARFVARHLLLQAVAFACPSGTAV